MKTHTSCHLYSEIQASAEEQEHREPVLSVLQTLFYPLIKKDGNSVCKRTLSLFVHVDIYDSPILSLWAAIRSVKWCRSQIVSEKEFLSRND